MAETSHATWDRRECLWCNLLLRRIRLQHPINIENPILSMLIGSHFVILPCWRFPRRGFAPPRNDILGGAVQQHNKVKFTPQYRIGRAQWCTVYCRPDRHALAVGPRRQTEICVIHIKKDSGLGVPNRSLEVVKQITCQRQRSEQRLQQRSSLPSSRCLHPWCSE